MDAENFTFDNSSNTKVVKHFSAVFPRIGISVLSDSFVVKAVNCSNLSGLVVTSKEGNVGWILQL